MLLSLCGGICFVLKCRTILEIDHLSKRTQRSESSYGRIKISGKLQLVCVIFVSTFFYRGFTTNHCLFLWVRMVSTGLITILPMNTNIYLHPMWNLWRNRRRFDFQLPGYSKIFILLSFIQVLMSQLFTFMHGV